MTIKQIRYAIAIAETGSMNKAANRFGVKQPSVSIAVAELEQELGIVIFDRDPKGMTLTDAGKEFLEGASRLASSFDQLEVRYGLCTCR
ncbi:MAG: LysR family transcriptional regulator [Oscillospiraceae bacterium]|nr:LysR family transcriptional regulator [Oscillospiraceae bacterium]